LKYGPRKHLIDYFKEKRGVSVTNCGSKGKELSWVGRKRKHRRVEFAR